MQINVTKKSNTITYTTNPFAKFFTEFKKKTVMRYKTKMFFL